MDADGGDVVMMDPATGEVLAVASRRRDGSARPSAFTDTFEPGSVAKIFTAAALLALQRVAPAERVSGEDGKYRLGGRTITDEEPLPVLTLADAIRVSSNIALVKFAARLAPAEQYAVLRAWGSGASRRSAPPAGAPGRRRPPAEWSGVSAGSLAMGYEVPVTPLQLAVAYAALANDGVLLAPTLIRDVRSPDGGVAYRHRAEPVRRVVRPEIAAALRALLRGVVEGGTGAEAALVNFPVAAKTGTARRVVGGRYAPGQYTASFAALFPADRAQLVLVVKIDDPRKGSYFAAQTAAPVTRSVLEQALAARTVALDRARLSTAAPRAAAQPLDDDPGVVPYVVTWPFRPDSVPAMADVARWRAVPDVTGRPLREAVRALHRRGFRVALKGWGVAHHTWPAAGDSAAAGPQVLVTDGRRAAGVAAETWYGRPAAKLDLVGVTGTSGKTTSVVLARHVLSALQPMGSIGTLGAFDPAGEPVPSEAGNLTTPGPIDLQATLAALVARGARGATMEVSSHSLDQGRVDGLVFRAAIFTNLTREHLDYHKTLEQYFRAKAKLASYIAADGLEVINADDPAWQRLPRRRRRVTFGERSGDVTAQRLAADGSGSRFDLVTPLGNAPVKLPLLGRFNVTNALGVAACAWGLGVPPEAIAERLSTAPQVPGRMERIATRPCTILRDYSHKPDALERALESVRDLTAGRVILVFGAGGDRDRGKRASMGEIAARLADVAIVTSDNPRTEDPERILDELEAGMQGKPHHRRSDRREAIALALELARPGDTMLLAGKGHETYQIVGSVKQPFDERAIVRELGAE